MKIAPTSVAPAPQVAPPATTPTASMPSGFADALATAQHAEPGKGTGAASGAAVAGKAASATTALPGKKEKGRATQDSPTSQADGSSPPLVVADLAIPSVNPIVLPVPPEPSGTTPPLPQAALEGVEPMATGMASQASAAMTSEPATTVKALGSPAVEPPPRNAFPPATSLPTTLSMPVTFAAPSAKKQYGEDVAPPSSSLPAASALAEPHAGMQKSAVSAPPSGIDTTMLKDLSGSASVGAQLPMQTPAHHGELPGKSAPAGNVSAAKPVNGEGAPSRSKTAGPENSNPGSGSTADSNTGASGNESSAAAKDNPFTTMMPAGANTGGTAVLGSEATFPAGSAWQARAAESSAAPAASATTETGRPAQLVPAGVGESTATINTAQVLGRMNGTEMRVGVRSEEFGSISIQTAVSPGNVVAQIALDHGALSRALAVHLPAMEEKLGNTLGLTARVELRDAPAQASTQGGGGDTADGGTPAHAGSGSGSRSTHDGGSARRVSAIDSGPRFAGGEVHGSSSGRLSVHA